MTDRLKDLRKKIDRIDDEIISLLLNRIDISKKIGRIKKEQSLAINYPSREKDILNRLYDLTEGKISEEKLYQIYQAIFDVSKQLQ